MRDILNLCLLWWSLNYRHLAPSGGILVRGWILPMCIYYNYNGEKVTRWHYKIGVELRKPGIRSGSNEEKMGSRTLGTTGLY